MGHRRIPWLSCIITLLVFAGQEVGCSFLRIPVTGSTSTGYSSQAAPVAANNFSSEAALTAGLISVEAPNIFSFTVKQQPADQPGFVAAEPGIVTQFAMAAHSGTIGLLAHNNLAGADFYALQPKQRVAILLANGIRRYYRVDTIQKFQALQPTNPYSDFIDLEQPGKLLSSSDVYQRIYQHVNRLVFQTCIEKEGNPSWGRMFITADPEEELVELALLRPWRNYYTY